MKKSQSKYNELAAWIKEQIASGNFLPGQKMYSENELKEKFKLSRQTVRHAIGLLVEEGVLFRRQGSGTYINDSNQANRGNKTRIAVVTTYVDGYIFPKTIQGIENVLFENGYSVQIAFTNNQISREKSILEDIILKDEVAGIIVETTKSGIPNPNLYLYKELQRKGIEVLFINSYYPALSIPHVSLNDKMAGKKAAEYLIEAGHETIGGIFKLDDGQGHMRYAGYVEALQSAGRDIDDSHIVWIDTEDIKNLEKCKNHIMGRLSGCTAVIFYNDQVAFTVADMWKQEGVKIPEDMSVISIDDSELSVIGDLAITAIPHPMERLGEKAAGNLLHMIANSSFEGTYEFEAEIIVRDSVKRMK